MPFNQFFGITEEQSSQFFGFAGFTFDNSIDLIVTVKEAGSGNAVEGAIVSAVWNGGAEFNEFTTGADGRAFFQISSNTVVSLTTTKDCFVISMEEVTHGGDTAVLFDVLLDVDQSEFDCFNPVPVNVANFFRWHEMELPSLPLQFPLTSCFCDIESGCFQQTGTTAPLLPNRWNRARRDPFGMKFVTGYDVAFYLNFTESTTLDPSRRLVIIDGTNIVAEDFADLIDDPFGEGVNVYAQFTAPELKDGLYFMAILNDSDEIILISNPIEYISSQISTTTGEIKYRNSLNMYGFNYEGLEDFETIARIPINAITAEYVDDETVYKEVSTRDLVAYKSETERRYQIETFYIDPGTHEAFAISIKHDSFFINGIELQKAGGYSIEVNRGYPRSKGLVLMNDQVFARLNQTVNKIN